MQRQHLYHFRHTADFGRPETVEDDVTGVSRTDFEKIATLHYARKNQTIADRYQSAGTDYQDTLVIIIRHNKTLSNEDVVFVKLDGKLYKCINYSVNDEDYTAVDMLTLKHVKRVG